MYKRITQTSFPDATNKLYRSEQLGSWQKYTLKRQRPARDCGTLLGCGTCGRKPQLFGT